ncbi:Hg(II)-responsive transcriptional regulator [Marinimicrobium sp. C6131]|uniref:Hg(II)-responsive transcriptional regulator n=1 Tax=Marinimicrobium sp. C6131 TaxID=3022676 RepID=UPI00223D98AE|nr:Hg(II)-responsive transcriptional regulator [Marinimicrobium sp. C6131]UZJ44397.1 Hg(II)-responsive transcriptional regulator [Marinimicrobium sp. C6131]
MPDKANSLTIGGLAEAANVSVETIRYYQRRGLIPEPQRPPSGIRRYGITDIDRLKFVKTSQQLGFSLDEIHELLQLDDGAHCHEVSVLAERKLHDVREKINKLRQIEAVLNNLVDQCCAQDSNISCPLIASLHEGVG